METSENLDWCFAEEGNPLFSPEHSYRLEMLLWILQLALISTCGRLNYLTRIFCMRVWFSLFHFMFIISDYGLPWVPLAYCRPTDILDIIDCKYFPAHHILTILLSSKTRTQFSKQTLHYISNLSLWEKPQGAGPEDWARDSDWEWDNWEISNL